MFIDDIQGRNHVMFDHVNEDIVVAHIGIIGFHIVSILLGETVVAFDTGTQFFQSLLEP